MSAGHRIGEGSTTQEILTYAIRTAEALKVRNSTLAAQNAALLAALEAILTRPFAPHERIGGWKTGSLSLTREGYEQARAAIAQAKGESK